MSGKPKVLIASSLLLALFIPVALPQTPACSWEGVERIVAVGDVHGDCDRFVALLRAAGVINERNAWTGGRTHLVQTGDVLDRGPDSRKAMDLLRGLEKEAEAAGGRVHALTGNHEAMVMQGDLRYVHPGEIESFGGTEGLLRALGPGGEYGRWIRGHNAVIRINDTLFLHGGLSPRLAGESLEALNAAVRAEMGTARGDVEGPATSDDGPLWYRGWAAEGEAAATEELERVCRAFGVRRVVVGHTVSKKGIAARFGGRLIMIDVGISRAYVGGDPACLLIEGGRFFVLTPGARREFHPGDSRPLNAARSPRARVPAGN